MLTVDEIYAQFIAEYEQAENDNNLALAWDICNEKLTYLKQRNQIDDSDDVRYCFGLVCKAFAEITSQIVDKAPSIKRLTRIFFAFYTLQKYHEQDPAKKYNTVMIWLMESVLDYAENHENPPFMQRISAIASKRVAYSYLTANQPTMAYEYYEIAWRYYVNIKPINENELYRLMTLMWYTSNVNSPMSNLITVGIHVLSNDQYSLHDEIQKVCYEALQYIELPLRDRYDLVTVVHAFLKVVISKVNKKLENDNDNATKEQVSVPLSPLIRMENTLTLLNRIKLKQQLITLYNLCGRVSVVAEKLAKDERKLISDEPPEDKIKKLEYASTMDYERRMKFLTREVAHLNKKVSKMKPMITNKRRKKLKHSSLSFGDEVTSFYPGWNKLRAYTVSRGASQLTIMANLEEEVEREKDPLTLVEISAAKVEQASETPRGTRALILAGLRQHQWQAKPSSLNPAANKGVVWPFKRKSLEGKLSVPRALLLFKHELTFAPKAVKRHSIEPNPLTHKRSLTRK